MAKAIQRQSPLAYGAKLFILLARPLSSKVVCPTHEFINEAALELLQKAGFESESRFLLTYLSALQEGVTWADSGYRNINHFFHPQTKQGLFGFANAAYDFALYLNKSRLYSKQKKWSKSCFYLGAAAHLLQDVCVPHHTSCLLFDGHKEYEAWAEQNYRDYFAPPAPLTPYFRRPFSLFFTNASASFAAFDLMKEGSTPIYQQVTKMLLPQAQYSTAGLFNWFYHLDAR
ncbi:MAG: zinc dependent phospholipase C family protein [Sporomusaceae bacterium]|nr:zinc dependent phospholipase C family protein [Sporomusaceae bacterium]